MSSQGVTAARLSALLGPDSAWLPPTVVASTGSTNADLASGKYGWEAGTVLIANHQSAGRGRYARSWQAEPGQAIATSVMLRPSREFSDWGWLSFLIGLAVQGAISSFADDPSRVRLKWPNDVLVDGRKICGILSEHTTSPDGAPVAICGWGVNVAMTQSELPVPTATSMSLAGMPVDHDRLAAAMLTELGGLYRAWDRGAELRDRYQACCSTLGKQVRVQLDIEQQPAEFIEGTAVDIAPDGSLLVFDGQQVLTFAAGDVVHLR